MRKTFDVATLRDSVNKRNRVSTCNADVRSGWNAVLERVLHDTGQYRGFRYLYPSEVPEGCEAGIIHENGSNAYPDPTRRSYL